MVIVALDAERLQNPEFFPISDSRTDLCKECSASHLNSELLVGSSVIVGSKGTLTCREMAVQNS